MAARLVERYKRPIYRLAKRLSAGTGIEDDIFQNAFVRAFGWVLRHPQADLEALEGFVLHCARLAAIDLLRHRSHLREAPEKADATGNFQPESSLISQLDLARLIANLPEQQRSVVELSLEGFFEREIGALLGISPMYAGVLKHRGIAGMRASLAGKQPPRNREDVP